MKSGIELRNISKTFRVPALLPWKPPALTQALKDVSFSCPENTITCLLGPNGSGKTTIVKILAGLVTPDSGEAALGGSVSTMAYGFHAGIGLATSNERSFYWRLTGRQNLEFFAALYGVKSKAVREKVGSVLEMVDLGAHADKPVRQYSSGMKQRLLLARALLVDPEVMLLDEPTTHLDHPGRKAIHGLIKDILVEKHGLTVLVCTNDLAEAKELADNLVLLNKGAVLAHGPLQVFHSMLREKWRLFLSFERFPSEGWISGSLDPMTRDGNTCACSIDSPALVPDIVEAAVRNGGRLLECSCTSPSLEEVFEYLIGEGK
jgi:ABC-2 type transport system ATP-binding protein